MTRTHGAKALAAAALAALIAAGGAMAQTAEPAAPAPAAPVAAPEAAPAPAAAAKGKPAPKKGAKKAAKAGGGVSVTVWNARAADLAELQVAPSGSDAFKKVLGKLKAGGKAGATAPKGKDCLIDLHATFADGATTDASGVDVCKQRTLKLTD